MPMKVIDLFAGPGGLGEGFSALTTEDGNSPFKIAISIEKEDSAHRTLLLRALFRQFKPDEIPEAYYDFLRGDLGKHPEDELYKLPELAEPLRKARIEAQKLTLGADSQKKIYGKIRNVIGKEDCILIGGPPCQAYSVAGKARHSGEDYIAAKDHRNFLYEEYLKVIAKFQPHVFVMENVKGMLTAKVDGKLIFESIRNDLQDPCKYTRVKPDAGRSRHKYKIYSFTTKLEEGELEPHDFIIRSENYGLPQARHRVILLGVREEIAAANLNKIGLLKPIKGPKVTVKQAISDLPKLRSRLSKEKDSVCAWRNAVLSMSLQKINELKYDEHVPSTVLGNLIKKLSDIGDSPEQFGADKGLQKVIGYNENLSPNLKKWLRDTRLGGYINNHETRGHIVGDLHRYIYYSTFAEVQNSSPKSNNLPATLWPQHKNFGSGKFADRFRVQLANTTATTITCHISKDGHYYIHYDPKQCRSLTVREAARIQTFPDNYYFVGNRTQQYVQVGNAVPPYLAKQLAKIVHKLLI